MLSIIFGSICLIISIISLAVSCSSSKAAMPQTFESSRYIEEIQKDLYGNILIKNITDTETGITTSYVFKYIRDSHGSSCEGFTIIVIDADGNLLEEITS